jgi:hypothetical protein
LEAVRVHPGGIEAAYERTERADTFGKVVLTCA